MPTEPRAGLPKVPDPNCHHDFSWPFERVEMGKFRSKWIKVCLRCGWVEDV